MHAAVGPVRPPTSIRWSDLHKKLPWKQTVVDAELSNRAVNSTDPLVEGMSFSFVWRCLPDGNPVRNRPQNAYKSLEEVQTTWDRRVFDTALCPIQSQSALQITASAGLANAFPGTSKEGCREIQATKQISFSLQ